MSESTTETTHSGPGQLLEQTRTELGLSTREISDELRLSPSQIRALEEDDYSSLPGNTYVRGYLRGYARLLNLPEAEILETYERATGGEFAKKTVSLAVVNKRLKSGDNSTKALIGIALLVVIGLTFVWWQGRKEYDISRFGLTSGSSQDEKQAQPEKEVTRVEESVREQVQESTKQSKTPVAAKQAPAPEAKKVAVVEKNTPEPVTPKVQKTAPVAANDKIKSNGRKPAAEKVAVATPKSEQKKVVEKAIKKKPVVTDSVASAEPKIQTIVLFFDKGSWADVRDVSNKRLLYRAVSQGQVVELKGKPPFKLFIGNADGVRMEYEGAPYDLSAHVTGVFARFVLGE